MSKSLKAIACIKAFRGSMAFAVGASIFSIPQNSTLLPWSDYLAPGRLRSYPVIETLINWVGSLSKEQLFAMGLLALALGMLRWTEAVGIWANKSWGHWLAISTGAVYIPFEINQLYYSFAWVTLCILVVNTLIVAYLLIILKRASLLRQ